MHDNVTIMNKLRIGVVGVTGYTGIELLKILDNHPMADIKFVGANSNYGPYPVSYTHLTLQTNREV